MESPYKCSWIGVITIINGVICDMPSINARVFGDFKDPINGVILGGETSNIFYVHPDPWGR